MQAQPQLPGIEPRPRPLDRKPEVLLTITLHADKYRPGFAEWLAENWAIWLRFEFEANKMRERGRRKWAARTIGEYIRHSTALREAGGDFKVNDHIWPDMARLYLTLHPAAAGFFELRGRQ
jgi:hypothetical protein